MIRALALGCTFIASVSCSFLIDFDEDDRPCGPNSECIDGYSCMVNRCVANRSAAIGETCSVDDHCELGAVCKPSAPRVCHEACEYAYGDGECRANEVCVAMGYSSGQTTSLCITGDCTGSPCDGANTTCIDIKAGVGRCFDSCQVICTAAGCSGNCPFADSRSQACQPVGSGDVLACVPEGSRQHGEPCDLESLLCDAEHACVMPPDRHYGYCLRYCDEEVADDCDPLIDPATGGAAECNLVTPVSGGSFAICGQLPSAPPSDGGPQGDSQGHTQGDAGGDSGPAAKRCREWCDDTPECNAGSFCIGNRCMQCEDSDDCVAHGSYFLQAAGGNECAADGDCAAVTGGPCVVDPNTSVSWCGYEDTEGTTGMSCFNFGTGTSWTKAEGGSVDVCVNNNWVCQNNLCVWPCTGDGDCLVRASGWYDACDAQDTCLGAVCIDIGGGVGRCATEASSSCPPTFSPRTMNLLAGGTASVCALQTQECTNVGGVNQCVARDCDGNTDCLVAAYPVCENPPGGTCVCDSTSCADNDAAHPECVGGACVCDATSCNANDAAHPQCVGGACVCDATSCSANEPGHPTCGASGACECDNTSCSTLGDTTPHRNTTWECVAE